MYDPLRAWKPCINRAAPLISLGWATSFFTCASWGSHISSCISSVSFASARKAHQSLIPQQETGYFFLHLIQLRLIVTLSQPNFYAMYSIDEYPDERAPLLRAEHLAPETHDPKIIRKERESKSSLTVTIAIFGRMSSLSCQ